MPSLPSSLPPPPAPASAPGPQEPPSGIDPPRAPDIPPWPIWTALAGVAVGFALAAMALILVDVAAAAGGSSLSHPTPAVSIAGDIVFDVGFVVAALYFASRGGRVHLADFGFRRAGWRITISAIVAAVAGYYGLTAIYASIIHLTAKDKLPSDLGVAHSTAALVAAAIFVCVIAPIAEEFFFRGFFFGALRRLRVQVAGRDIGGWVAALITGVLFGLAHKGSAPLQDLVPLGFLGFVLCIVRWRTGSLYPCMALHSANNALALGVVQLSWTAPEIIGLILAAWAVIAVITAPLGARSPRIA
jgi:membrane protease YdiL (CAAX protease family)